MPKSAPKSAPGVPFKRGRDARRGKGPLPGEGGRPKDVVRLACRQAFDVRLDILTKIADGKLKGVSPADRIRAMDVLARHGGMTYSEVDARLDARVNGATGTIVTYELAKNGMEPGAREAAIEAFTQRFGRFLPPESLALLSPPPGGAPAGEPPMRPAAETPATPPPPVAAAPPPVAPPAPPPRNGAPRRPGSWQSRAAGSWFPGNTGPTTPDDTNW